MAYTFPQLKQLAINAGFTGNSANTISAIALAESGGNPAIINHNASEGCCGSYGLLQINAQAHGIDTATAALDPQTAFNTAYGISAHGTDFSPWSTYKSGAYQPFLEAANLSGNDASTTLSFGGATVDLNGNPIVSQIGTGDNNASGNVVDMAGNPVTQSSTDNTGGAGQFGDAGFSAGDAGSAGGTGGGIGYQVTPPATESTAGITQGLKIPDVANAIGKAVSGAGSAVSEGITTGLANTIRSAENYLARGGVMLLAIILALGALILLMPNGAKQSLGFAAVR